jgi:hypothetical protein
MGAPPASLDIVAWITIAVGVASAGVVMWDILGRGHRQRMRVMEWVWPITCLYTGPLGLWAYHRFGLPHSGAWLQRHGLEEPPEQPHWASTALGVSHCGAGCTLADVIAAWGIFIAGLTIAGMAVYPEMIGDYILAIALGLAFQYFAIAPMRDLSVGEGILAAAKADVLSLTAFQVGMFGWMLLQAFVIFPAPHTLHPDSPVYWLGMQIGMCLGFVTAWPVNVWLIRRGIKEAM